MVFPLAAVRSTVMTASTVPVLPSGTLMSTIELIDSSASSSVIVPVPVASDTFALAEASTG